MLRKKCDRFTFILAGLLVQWRGFKNFSGSLKSCKKVERIRSENSADVYSGVSYSTRLLHKKECLSFFSFLICKTLLYFIVI